jgi:LytS/YehU family sensor histidine kinase
MVIAVVHLALHYNIVTHVISLFLPEPGMPINLSPFPRIGWRFMVYFIILIACYAMESQKRIRREEQQTIELRVELANAQLQALKMQLHPHFLFNTLNSISELMHHDLRAADEMIIRLSDFLRLTLDPAVTQEVTLEKELEFLNHYLEIEQVRFKDRLSVDMNIDPKTMQARVPYLVLQPLVENAIRHGIAPHSSVGKLVIESSRNNGMLRLEITDNGPGLPQGTKPESCFKKGLGLSNTRARLEKLYGTDFRLDLTSQETSGLTVTLELPFHESSPPAGGKP